MTQCRTRLTGQEDVLWAMLDLFYHFTVPNVPKMGQLSPHEAGQDQHPSEKETKPLAQCHTGAGSRQREQGMELSWCAAVPLLGCQQQDKISPHERGAEQKGSRGSPCHQAAIRACPRCHCPLSSRGTFVSLCPVVPMCFFTCGVCVTHSESALPSATHLSILLSTREAENLTGGQEAFANTPFNAHFFLRAMEELRGKA